MDWTFFNDFEDFSICVVGKALLETRFFSNSVFVFHYARVNVALRGRFRKMPVCHYLCCVSGTQVVKRLNIPWKRRTRVKRVNRFPRDNHDVQEPCVFRFQHLLIGSWYNRTHLFLNSGLTVFFFVLELVALRKLNINTFF